MIDWDSRGRGVWRGLWNIILGVGIVFSVAGCASSPAEAEKKPTITSTPPTAYPTAFSPEPSTGETQVVQATALSKSPVMISAKDSPLTVESPQPTPTMPVASFTYEVVGAYPHDPGAWTQGLVYADGIFYEGTGLRGQSTLRRVEPSTGNILSGIRLPDELFGEGITIFKDKIYQLTWQSQMGFVLDKESFELLETFHYPTEGWGLTHDGDQLIMSDGTDQIHFLDPDTLERTGSIAVRSGANPVELLNELEFIDGEIYANVWLTDLIAIIDPISGQVNDWIDLTGLLSPETNAQPIDVLNGIAYDNEENRLFVTGKLWPTIFEIRLVEKGE